MQKLSKHEIIFVCAVSLFVVLVSVLIPRGTIVVGSSKDTLTDIRLGLPIAFVSQNQSNWDPPVGYPWGIKLSSPWESPIHILWVQLILSFIIVVCITFFIIVIFRAIVSGGRQDWKNKVNQRRQQTK